MPRAPLASGLSTPEPRALTSAAIDVAALHPAIALLSVDGNGMQCNLNFPSDSAAIRCRVVPLADRATRNDTPLLIIRVAFVGDSITEGNASHRDGPTPKRGGGHVPLAVRAELERRSATRGLSCGDSTATERRVVFNVGTFAASSTTASNVSHKWSFRNRQAYQDALAFHPDVLVLMLGTNDAKDHLWGGPHKLASDLVAIASAFTTDRAGRGPPARKQPWIVLGVPPPLGRIAGTTKLAGFNTTIHNSYMRPAYEEAAAALAPSGVTIVNFFNAFLRHANVSLLADLAHICFNRAINALFVDGVHPTVSGHELMASEFFDQLCPS